MILLSAVAVLAVGGLIAGITAPLATAGSAATPSATHVSNYELNARADAPAKTSPSAAGADADDPEIRYTESPLTSDDPVITIAPPTRCPEGTVPGVVDANGNESNCEALNG